jgi:serine phosphatase RsbU (regulator of sigma subunit)/anti-sigma regulatory factor (Ser/Thr protein kinase)
MNQLAETYHVTLPPDLGLTKPTVARLLAWAQLHGWPAATTEAWRLPLTEALVNAIKHGSGGKPAPCIQVSVHLLEPGMEFRIRDAGRFAPGPEWSQLPEDPLSESGRGGYLIAQSTEYWRHENDATGHTLILGWRSAPATPVDLPAAAQSMQVVENLTGELANNYEMLSGYAHLVGLLATARDFTDLLLGVRARLAGVVPHSQFILRFRDAEQLVRSPGALPDAFPAAIPLDATGLEAWVATSGRFLTINSARELARNDPLAPAGAPLVVLPIVFANRILGTLVVAVPVDEPLFSAGQIELLQSVADFIGIAHATDHLNRSREQQLRLQQDIVIAASIQRLLLPQAMPVMPGWRVSGSCRPAREIGGDYFDFFVRPDRSCLVVIADVMGKGVPAALVASMLRTALRARAGQSATPGELLTLINAELHADLAMLEVFITATLILLPAGGPTLHYANAGHCPPLLLQAGKTTELGGGDIPLGVMAGVTFTDLTAAMPPGGTLFAYTDGCFEWRKATGSFLGSARFATTLADHTQRGTPDLVNVILDDIAAQAGPAGLPDDCTLVAMHRQA